LILWQILLHFIGDFVLQNNWMANNKHNNHTKKGYYSCLVHCLIYSLPFLFITSYMAVLGIFISHFLIDKYYLAKFVMRLKNWCFTGIGFPDDTPEYISTWLVIILDNIMHIIINYLLIFYL
jgi:hypothetical protein